MAEINADLIIIGAGPAGLSAAQYGARSNLSVLVLEQMAPGGQALLIDVLENYPGIAPGKTGFESAEADTVNHRRADRDDFSVFPRQVNQRLPENIRVKTFLLRTGGLPCR